MRLFQALSTLALLLSSGTVVNTLAEPTECPTDPSLKGFTTITDLNQWMSKVWYFINSGGFYPSPYFFSLCPNTVYDDTFIFPVLNDTWIICGALGSSDDNCLIQTSDTQIVILPHDYTSEGALAPPLEHVNFLGLTMRKSTDVSVGAYGATTAWAFFKDCHWVDNLGRFAIHILPPSSSGTTVALEKGNTRRNLQESSSMLVQLVDCSFESNKQTHSTIVNNGGTLLISDVVFKNNENAWANILTYDDKYTHIENTLFEETTNYFTIIAIQGTLHLENVNFIANTNSETVVHIIDQSHLVAENCLFSGNNNSIGPGLIDDQSILFLSEGNSGSNNSGFGCEGFLLIDEGEECDVKGECPASCCLFEDTTCDVQTSKPSTSNTPTVSPSSSPIASVSPTDSTKSPTVVQIISPTESTKSPTVVQNNIISEIEGKDLGTSAAGSLSLSHSNPLLSGVISGIIGFALFY